MPRMIFNSGGGGGASKYLVEPGEYTVTLSSYQWKTTKDGREAAVLRMNIDDTHWVDQYLYFEDEKDVWKTSLVLRALGYSADNGADVEVNDGLLHSLIGRQSRVIIGHRPWQGEKGQMTSNTIKRWLVPGDKQEDLSIKEEDIPF